MPLAISITLLKERKEIKMVNNEGTKIIKEDLLIGVIVSEDH